MLRVCLPMAWGMGEKSVFVKFGLPILAQITQIYICFATIPFYHGEHGDFSFVG